MGTSNTKLSPRQKMINLMYIVLMAMLALNVSSDVLDGFTQVKDGLTRTNLQVEHRNAAILNELEAFSVQNPEKGTPWYEKGLEVHRMTQNLYNTIEDLKLQIVQEADGSKGSLDNIINRENLDAASIVMLDPSTLRGAALRGQIDTYRDYITELVGDSLKRESVSSALSTDPVMKRGQLGEQLWEEYKFENQPVVASVTLLTKLQNDLMFAEGEALNTLLSNVDAGDVRVNELNAFVIPDSRLVMRGGKYQADIVLAAIDTTARPAVYVNGNRLSNDRGFFEAFAGSTGSFDYSGYIEVPHGDGSVTRHNFNSSYTVIEPSATVSATLMNVLYAGIENPISISVPGVSNNAVTATMTNGTLSRSGDNWIAKPSKVGENAVITVTANLSGSNMEVAKTTFRVRKLPDPSPFILYTDAQGNQEKYRGGGKGISKQQLLNSPGIEAAIDDNLLNINFKVLSFQTVTIFSTGDAKLENSDGAKFSQRQKEQFKNMKRGNRFFISNVKAVGPDGITREIAPLEVVIN